MKLKIYIVALVLLFPSLIISQSYSARHKTLNVLHYKLNIALNDTSNEISGLAEVNLRFRKKADEFYLDLVSYDSITKFGMKVDSVFQNNKALKFTHENNKLTIYPEYNFPNVTYKYSIKYSGTPEDGLIIGKNMYGNRTFFADNWPNRAHNWFPCVDHPSDKASVEFDVEAPKHYQIIANGKKVKDTLLNDTTRKTIYIAPVPLPTKVLVIGAADFAIDTLGKTKKIPVSTWVYPENKEQGFSDFKKSGEILEFFINNIGKYPYKKLANVQSSTRYGGMENASCIFYPEKAIDGSGRIESTLVHEIAHQWFGNSITEIDWPHVWLSEGFATYFTDVYYEKTQGIEVYNERMARKKEKIHKYNNANTPPIVDVKTKDINKLLNINTYDKGAFVLHMLRKQLGDETFFKAIKIYYDNYKLKNASTDSFRKMMERISGQDLTLFFKQWLYTNQHPIIKPQWIYFNNKIRIMIDQLQETPFLFKLDIELLYADGTSEIKTIDIHPVKSPFSIETKGEVVDIKFDPNNWLLLEVVPE